MLWFSSNRKSQCYDEWDEENANPFCLFLKSLWCSKFLSRDEFWDGVNRNVLLFRSESAIKWLRTLVVLHAAHLISNPDITEVFSPLFPLIESKLNVIGPLYRLAGRLDLMIQQIKHRTDKSEKSLQSVSLQPKLIYQDEGMFQRWNNFWSVLSWFTVSVIVGTESLFNVKCLWMTNGPHYWYLFFFSLVNELEVEREEASFMFLISSSKELESSMSRFLRFLLFSSSEKLTQILRASNVHYWCCNYCT